MKKRVTSIYYQFIYIKANKQCFFYLDAKIITNVLVADTDFGKKNIFETNRRDRFW